MALQNDHCCEHGNETEETRALRHQQEDHAKEADRQDCIENEDSVDTDLSPHRHNLFAVSLDSVTLNDDLLKHLIANHVELLVRNQQNEGQAQESDKEDVRCKAKHESRHVIHCTLLWLDNRWVRNPLIRLLNNVEL